MINKKRIELYMQRKARMHDTHEDVVSDDFDMDDCDFRLDGTEGEYKISDTVEVPNMESSLPQVTGHLSEDPPEDPLAIPQLPDIHMDRINNQAYEKWCALKDKEKTLNKIDKNVLRSEIKKQIGPMSNSVNTLVPRTPIQAIQYSHHQGTVEALHSLKGRSITSISDLNLDEVQIICELAGVFQRLVRTQNHIPRLLEQKVVTLFFGEPSTRTRCSFQAASYRLGAQVIVVDNDKSCSTMKGESLYDSVRCLGSYSDAVVIRSVVTGSIPALKDHFSFPILSGGDGKGEHPTQAVLDVATMLSCRPDLFDDNRPPILVVFCGDMKNGRTVHSLSTLLARIPKIEMIFVGPDSLQIPSDHFGPDVCYRMKCHLDKECGRADFLYVTRLQRERLSEAENAQTHYDIVVDKDLLVKIQAKPDLRIMHPLPRVDEIGTDIDDLIHQLYFDQAEYGMYTRMAILALCLSDDRIVIQNLLNLFRR